jgi:DNA-binding CsgD family transcriptional regulator
VERWKDTVHHDDAPALLEPWLKSLASIEPYEAEVRRRDRTGEYHWYRTRAVPVFKGGKIIKWCGTNFITSTKATDDTALAAAEALAAIGLPAVLLGPDRRVIAANQLFDRLPQIHWRARDRIRLADRAADALLAEALAKDIPQSFALRARDGGLSWIGRLMPIRGTARDLFLRCAGVLVLTPVALPQAPPVSLLRSLFGLTVSEAQVARSLVTGDSLIETAAATGVSHNTVRSQLRGALVKTGCTRQAELVALLSSVGLFDGVLEKKAPV